jgi:diphthamide biosynthesis protein 4
MNSSHNLYEVLGLVYTPSSPPTPSDIKAAYHRSLLIHHPDKSSTPTSSKPTIDAIISAYATLSDTSSRQLYDRTLLTTNPSLHKSSPANGLTGEERIDLDDMTYDDSSASYIRACRCGDARGHEVREEDLEAEAARGGAGEVLVQCAGCTLWLRVEFCMVDDGGDGGEEDMRDESRPLDNLDSQDCRGEIRLSG